jgi:gas vesicle protein
MSTGRNLTLILSSLAAGAALGLLLAPAAGSETRRNLIRRGEGLRDKLNDLYDEGADFVSRKRDQFAEMADRVRDHAEEVTSSSGNTGGSRSGSQGGSSNAGRSGGSSTGSTSGASGTSGTSGARSGNTGRS